MRAVGHGRLGLLLLVVLAMSAPGFAFAEMPSSEPARKIFVDAIQGKFDSAQLRERVVARLRASHEVQVVDQVSEADFIVHGNGEAWVKGYIAADPHSSGGAHQAVYGGYLSLEVENRSGEALWSYLVTPGRMYGSDADQEMAKHIVRLMLVALKNVSPLAAQPLGSAPRQIALSGAGSTFSAPLYQTWIDSFVERRTEVHATYQAVGSEEGIRLLEEGKVDFAASDVPATDEQLASMQVKFSQYATVLGGVVPAYNLAGAGRDLRFTPEILAGIYLGKITKWNDPRLRALNHGVSLPDASIIVLHRSDGSGTTFAWTEFLSRTSPEWKAGVGIGMRVSWPVGQGESGNEGVAGAIAQTPGAIGYIELTYAIHHELSFGLVRNTAGRFVQANLDTLSNAALRASTTGDLRTSLVNAPGNNAYPIATFTWILAPLSTQNPQKAAALADLVQWMLTSGQKDCSALGYVPLPKDLAAWELSQMHPVAAANSQHE